MTMNPSFKKEAVEKKLNKDKKFRERFLKTPVEVLKAEGLDLTDEKAEKLRLQLSELAGRELPSGASVAANGVMISISKSF